MARKIKSSLVVLLAVILAASIFVACGKKEEEAPEQTKQQTYLFLGDSIAEALLGPSPISERDSYGYYSIVGQSNGARYINRAISGLTSIGFANSLLCRRSYEEPDAFYREYWIQEADVIFISMLGNDVLGRNMIRYAIDTGKASTAAGKPTVSDEYAERLQERCGPNMREGMERIYGLNPDAVVVWQTLYNPFYDETVLLDEDDWALFNQEKANGTIDEKYTFRELADILVNAMNQIAYDYQKDNPDKKFYVSDVKGAMDKVFEADVSEGEKLIFTDCIHPSVRGHALIAECLEQTLCEHGLSNEDQATERYKTVVSDRLDRLYPTLSTAKTAVRQATTFSAVTTAYFTATEGVEPTCENNLNLPKNGNYLEEDRYYELSSLTLDDLELTSIDLSQWEDLALSEEILNAIDTFFPNGIEILDLDDSYLGLEEDGSFVLSLALSRNLLGTLNAILSVLGDALTDFDVVDFYRNEPFCEFNTTYEMYFAELFPGFDPVDLKRSIECLSMVGCTIEGIDTESGSFTALADSLRENGTLPSGFRLPERFDLKLQGNYTVETLGEGDKARTVAYLRLVRTGDDTIPMFCVLLSGDEEYDTAMMKIEFCSVRLFFQTEKTR